MCFRTLPDSSISLFKYIFTLLWVFCEWTDTEADNFFLYLDEETESLFLVDFTQKIINQRNEPQTRTANVAWDRDGEDSDVNVPVPAPQNANEEWYIVFINVFWTWLRGNMIWTQLWVFLLTPSFLQGGLRWCIRTFSKMSEKRPSRFSENGPRSSEQEVHLLFLPLLCVLGKKKKYIYISLVVLSLYLLLCTGWLALTGHCYLRTWGEKCRESSGRERKRSRWRDLSDLFTMKISKSKVMERIDL